MLEHLFGSRTRVKLLGLFLKSPDDKLYVREITRRVDTQINAVRRELSNLQKLGLIQEVIEEVENEKKQAGVKKKYYRVNPDFKLITELTSLVMRARVLLEGQLDQEIIKLGDIRYLAFMGSFLGESRAPVDLFIVGDIDQKKLEKLVRENEEGVGFEINFSLMPFDEFQYRKDMTDKFLYAILEARKNIVVDRLRENTA
jgi:predicted transcriptional regulator